MGNTRDTGYLQNLVTYDASGNIVLPANLTVNGNLLVATQSYVTTQINNLINGAPALLDTLDELAAALGDDANFASTVTTSIAGKQAQLNGTGFVKVTGTTVSYDNSTYLTTSSASSTYVSYTGATQDVNLGVYSIATNSVLANQITVNPSGSTGAQVFLKHGSSFSLPNGFGSIGSSTGNQFRLYQVSSEGVWKGANISLNSITASATRTYTLPDADGTIALTSSLGAYLPLAGGTLTGALNGTSASFTGGFELNTTGTGALGFFGANNTTDKYIRIRNSSGNFEMGTSSSEHYLLSNGGIPLKFYTNGSPSLTLASTGVATFSSSVVANGVSSIGQEQAFTFQRTTGTPSDIFSLNVDSGAAYLYNNTTANTLMFWREGGNVGIGAFPSNSKLLVAGTHVTGNSIIGVLPIGNNTATIGLYNASGVRRGLFYSDTGFVRVESDSDQIQIAPAGTVALTLATTGAATFSSSVTTGGNINVNSDGIFINRSSSGEPYVFFQKNGVNRGSIYGVTGGGLRIFDESDNQVLTITGTRLGISDPSPSRKLTVNFGTSVNDGLIVYGSQRQNTVFRSTSEHCFLFIDSHHADTFLPVLTFQRSSVSYGSIGLNRASNSDGIGAYAESEMVVGTTTTVPFSIQTNSQRRIRVASGGGVEVFNTLSVSGNLTARNFSKFIKSWAPAGSTGSGTSTTYNWADELASVAGNFDSGGYYRGFIRSGNGAHYYGYHFDILVGSIGYGGNSLQFKVQNLVGANSPWAGGCGFPPFGTVDNTNFTHINNPCGEYLELYITKLGG